MKEIYKDIKGYEGLYQVSNLGNVKSLYYNKLLSICKQDNGYSYVCLWKNKKETKGLIHRLVAETFISNPHNLPQVNHINEDKTDNRIENLEWCDCKYNSNYGTRGERISKNKMSDKHPLSKHILQYTKDGQFVKEWCCAYDAMRELNINQSSITKCCKDKLKTSGGFVWKYKEEKDYKLCG